MAPKSIIDVYFAPWAGDGYLNSIDQAIHNDDYAAISISYGIDEDMQGDSEDPAWPLLNQNVDAAFREAAAIGLPVFVSSGDQRSGSQRGFVGQDEVTALSLSAHIAYPASSTYATAVGGTMLYGQNGAITLEVVWTELGDPREGQYQDVSGQLQTGQFYLDGATVGGVSNRYPDPSYQTGAGINLASANTPSSSGRCVPDVGGNAGSTTGYLVSQPPNSQVAIAPRASPRRAPMWAALLACVRDAYIFGTPTSKRTMRGGRSSFTISFTRGAPTRPFVTAPATAWSPTTAMASC
jgi:kumamolisin